MLISHEVNYCTEAHNGKGAVLWTFVFCNIFHSLNLQRLNFQAFCLAKFGIINMRLIFIKNTGFYSFRTTQDKARNKKCNHKTTTKKIAREANLHFERKWTTTLSPLAVHGLQMALGGKINNVDMLYGKEL